MLITLEAYRYLDVDNREFLYKIKFILERLSSRDTPHVRLMQYWVYPQVSVCE